jgi:alkanesulfonate monooxygenase SsuD/methylene tetrahydromethanopterin reductase-like flavin-dependent oxidoreductase (luciferase family)
MPPAALYREAVREARHLEALGFDTVWMGEHHFSYDGYCPSLLPAAAMFLASTTTIRVASGVLVLPFHPADRVAEGGAALHAIAPGRFRLAVGLGYRELEYAAAGLRVSQRAALMEQRLAALTSGPLSNRLGTTDLWVGCGASAAVARAARHGCSLLLLQTVSSHRLTEFRAQWEGELVAPPGSVPRFGVAREVWVDENPRRLEWARGRLFEMWRHYSNFWVDDPIRQQARREQLAARMAGLAIFGPPEEVAESLISLVEVGVDTLCLRVRFDGVGGDAVERCLDLLATKVVPSVRAAA